MVDSSRIDRDDAASGKPAAKPRQTVIDLLSDSDDGNEETCRRPAAASIGAPAKKKAAPKTKPSSRKVDSPAAKRPLQAGLVLEEDVGNDIISDGDNNHQQTVESYVKQQQQRIAAGKRPILFHDKSFAPEPSSIQGTAKQNRVEKCRCSPPQPAAMSYVQKDTPNKGRPYHHCAKRKCQYFSWALSAERLHWYRFGSHTNHVLVGDAGFSANDLVQGRVGDCWFLSALSCIAERPDLIMRLFGGCTHLNNPYGMVQVNLFLDGQWKPVIVDNFLPCMIDDKNEEELQQAMRASLQTVEPFSGTGYVLSDGGSTEKSTIIPKHQQRDKTTTPSSKYDPHVLSDINRQVLMDINGLLHQENKPSVAQTNPPRSTTAVHNPYARKEPTTKSKVQIPPSKLNRVATNHDLAYSKAKHNQLWVPLLEKAYAKSHGCYQSISGGQIHEAFLDLTGAPTLEYRFEHPQFQPRKFWYQLLSYRLQRLPMGCAAANSAEGILGMHAYSVLDVREIRNVSADFFRDQLFSNSLGNVSGFTEFDGTVRLLRIRNPHGQGEWKGAFSDHSDAWERLLRSTNNDQTALLERTFKNDGTFWIDYDNFLMGFVQLDVVLAFQGNHGKSFVSNFPLKQSNHRCTRCFEVSLLDVQPGVPSRDTVELYIIGIQKTRRGAYHGRTDRKKSYKVSDLGILTMAPSEGDDAEPDYGTVQGQMFGFKRNGHYHLILDRKKNKSLLVLPISFGHPAATDKERSFVLRFVADAPVMIRELPDIPRLDKALNSFCLNPTPSIFSHSAFEVGRKHQGQKKLLLDDTEGARTYGEPLFRVFQINCLAHGGGVVFVYLTVNRDLLVRKEMTQDWHISLVVEATCRGMMFRVETGFLEHQTIAKGKKFQAAWRKFQHSFYGETKTRLLAVLVQSGQDSEMGSMSCKTHPRPPQLQKEVGNVTASVQASSTDPPSFQQVTLSKDRYDVFGVFSGVEKIDNNDSKTSIFGPNPCHSHHVHDLELQQALEASKQQFVPYEQNSEHLEVQLALERSRAESTGTRSILPTENVSPESFSQDLEKAIQLSLQETKRPRPVAKHETKDAQSSLLDVKPSASNNVFVVDLANEDETPVQKKQKTIPKENDIIELSDDEDSNDGDHCMDPSVPAVDSISAEGKRRLAAEAAEKRFASVLKPTK